jgi:hypothetical protein
MHSASMVSKTNEIIKVQNICLELMFSKYVKKMIKQFLVRPFSRQVRIIRLFINIVMNKLSYHNIENRSKMFKLFHLCHIQELE